jgi:LysR family hydrogen peroxide-inducible transcriptional activator
MKSLAQQARDPLSGTLRLGAFPTLSTYIFPELVPQLMEAMPRLRLELVEEKTAILVEQLLAGSMDAALLALPVGQDALEERPLFDDPFWVAVPDTHALSKADQVSHDDLQDYSMLLLEEGHCLRDQALGFCQRYGIDEQQNLRATGLETLRQMVRAGTGITFMPDIARQAGERGITYLPFTDPVPSRTIGLVYRKTSVKTPLLDQLHTMITAMPRAT